MWGRENATTKTWIGLVLKSAYKNRISFDMNSWADFRSMNCTPPVSPRLSLSLHTLHPLQSSVKIYYLHTSGFPVPCNETGLQRSYEACPESKDTKVFNVYIFNLQEWPCEWTVCT
jgi:hypothetical protein